MRRTSKKQQAENEEVLRKLEVTQQTCSKCQRPLVLFAASQRFECWCGDTVVNLKDVAMAERA